MNRERWHIPQPGHDLHRLGALLARWHLWRKTYSPERGYARQGGPSDPEDDLELMLMTSIEAAVDEMPPELQRSISHLARAECLGVDCSMEPQGYPGAAIRALRGYLIAAGAL